MSAFQESNPPAQVIADKKKRARRMPDLRTTLKRWLRNAGVTVSRSARNRFDGTDDFLAGLARRGFDPTRVIDCGAHVGSFALLCHQHFPQARIHLIEPQPACQPHLQALAARHDFIVHACAVSDQPGQMKMITVDGLNTGAYVLAQGEPHEANRNAIAVTVSPLDALITPVLGTSEQVLIKLDLQGHELKALRGASKLLRHTELVVIEALLFGEAGHPAVAEVVRFFDEAGFELHDIASLFGRIRDGRAQWADLAFVRRGSALASDTSWH
jgi:FkbM family methyltransferase